MSGQAGRKKKKEEADEEEPHNEIIMTHIGMEKFARACMLTSAKCPMFDVQRASVRPAVLEPADDASPFMLRLYDFEYRFPDFLEALVRYAKRALRQPQKSPMLAVTRELLTLVLRSGLPTLKILGCPRSATASTG